MNRPAHIAVILVAFDASKTLAALRFVRRLEKKIQSKFSKILVLNHPSLSNSRRIRERAGDWAIVYGTNTQAEISGWQEGLEYLAEIERAETSVLFLNDTVVSHRFFSVFREYALSKAITDSAGGQLIGFVDDVPSDCVFSIDDLSISGWVSTYCFFLTATAIDAIGHTIWEKQILSETVFGGVDESLFFSDRVSSDLRKYLCNWLFRRGWYSAKPLNSESHDQLVIKAKSIIAEKWLSVRCIAADVSVVDPFDHHRLLRTADRWMTKFVRFWRTVVVINLPSRGRQKS